MPRCKICKEKFEPRFFLQKSCFNPKCVIAWKDQVKANEWKEKKKKLKPVVNESKNKNLLQKEINKLARNIDTFFDYNCIDCNKLYQGQRDGAHYHNVGGNENLRFNLHNIHKSRGYCNRYSPDHKTGYYKGLTNRYGVKYRDYIVLELPMLYKYLGLNAYEIAEALKKARKANREFSEVARTLQLNSIDMRNYYNEFIGIYKKNFIR